MKLSWDRTAHLNWLSSNKRVKSASQQSGRKYADTFEQQLVSLREKVITMAQRAEEAVARGVQAVVESNDEAARHARELDQVLDNLEIEIDQCSIKLLARAPLALEVRLIITAMKIGRELERVGDEATKILRRAPELKPDGPSLIDVQQMAKVPADMLKTAISAFLKRDADLARAVIPRDAEVDALNKQHHRELASHMIEKPATITRCLSLMVVSKSLERIADHATNIAEEVVYLCEGRDIRHTGKGQAFIHWPDRTDQPVQIRAGNLLVDVPGHIVTVNNKRIDLTATEFKLLLLFARRGGRVQTRGQLLQEVWDYNSLLETRTVDTHVRRLRKKLGPAAKFLRTIRGVGYKFTEQE